MKEIISYFSKSTAKTLTLLLMVLGVALLSLPNTDNSTQRIAEESTLDAEEQNFLDILNEHRADLDLPELEAVPILNEAAEWMVNDLLEKGDPKSHIDSLGRNPQERLGDFGYIHDGGENIALSGPTGQDVFESWMNSSSHAATMKNPDWKAIGIASLRGANPGTLWVTNFGDTVTVQNEEDEEETSCGPNRRSDSGEFDNECKEILDCESDDNRGAWCLCTDASECISQKCSTADVDDKKFCEEGPAPTDEEEEDDNEEQRESQEITVNLKAILPGIGTSTATGQNNNPLRKTRPFFIEFVNDDGETIQTEETNLTYNNGVFEGTLTATVPEGEYTLEIATDNSLFQAVPRVLAVDEQSTQFTLPQVTLVTGNIAQNDSSKNALDIFDYNALLSCYGGKSCANSTLADLNEDGKVDSLDFNIMLRGFAVQ